MSNHDSSTDANVQQIQSDFGELNAKVAKTLAETTIHIRNSQPQQAYTQWEQLLSVVEGYYDARREWVEQNVTPSAPDFAAFWRLQVNIYKSHCFLGMGTATGLYRPPSEARALFEQALSLLRESDSPHFTILKAIAITYRDEGNTSEAFQYEAKVNAELARSQSPVASLQRMQNELSDWRTRFAKTAEESSGLLISGDSVKAQQVYTQWQQLLAEVEGYYDARHIWVGEHVGNEPIGALWQSTIRELKGECFYWMGAASMMYMRPPDARTYFEQGLSLLGDEPHPLKVQLLQSIGNSYNLEGAFSRDSEYQARAADELRRTPVDSQMGLNGANIGGESAPLLPAVHSKISVLMRAASDSASRGAPIWLDQLEEAYSLAAYAHSDDDAKQVCLSWLSLCLQQPDCFGRVALDVNKLRLQGSSATCSDKWAERSRAFIDDDTFRAQLDRSLARHWVARNDYETAKRILTDAKNTTPDLLVKKGILDDLAEVNEKLGIYADEIANLKEAYQIVKDNTMLASELLTRLILAEMYSTAVDESTIQRHIDCLQQLGGEASLAEVLSGRALGYFQEGERDRALEVLDKALSYVGEVGDEHGPMGLFQAIYRINLLFAKTVIFWEMNKLADALQVCDQAITALKEVTPAAVAECAKTYPTIPPTWRPVLRYIQWFHWLATYLNAAYGNAREAFESAESGKARLLNSQLAMAQIGSADPEHAREVNVDEMRARLPPKSALVSFCVTNKGTAVLVLEPNKNDPFVFMVDVTLKDLAFAQQPASSTPLEWGDLAAELPRLRGLVHPLQNIAHECDIVYLVPDSSLYAIPFAALQFEDGTTLIDHCAIAYAPSATVLARRLSQRPDITSHSCLAIAVGAGGEDDALFAYEAKKIVADNTWSASRCLVNEEATPEHVLNDAKLFSVIHLTCHGNIEPNAVDTLRASSLILADAQHPLTAYDVYKHGQLRAELVFLDACLSGAFSQPLGSEVGGFWHAFLHAGASSLIATLVSVDKRAADFIATQFYSEWLHKGRTKAEALRQAQLQLRAQVDDPYWWATHVLIGDYH